MLEPGTRDNPKIQELIKVRGVGWGGRRAISRNGEFGGVGDGVFSRNAECG